MLFILIDTSFGAENAVVATNEDGENLVFDLEHEAKEYGENNLQSFVIVPVDF